ASSIEIRQLSQLILQSAKELKGMSSDPEAEKLLGQATTLQNDRDLESACLQARALHGFIGSITAQVRFDSIKLGAMMKARYLEDSAKEEKKVIISSIPQEADFSPYAAAATVLEHMTHREWQ